MARNFAADASDKPGTKDKPGDRSNIRELWTVKTSHDDAVQTRRLPP